MGRGAARAPAVDPAAVVVDRVVAAPQDPVVAGQPVVVEQVRASPTPCRCGPADRRHLLGASAARSSARSRRPAPSSAAAGAAATGTRWCPAAPARRAPAPSAGARRACPGARRRGRRLARALVDPHARRPGTAAAAPTPAGPARPGRCRARSHSPARYVGESTSARTCGGVEQLDVVAGRGSSGGQVGELLEPRAAPSRRVSSPVSSHAQSMP